MAYGCVFACAFSRVCVCGEPRETYKDNVLGEDHIRCTKSAVSYSLLITERRCSKKKKRRNELQIDLGFPIVTSL